MKKRILMVILCVVMAVGLMQSMGIKANTEKTMLATNLLDSTTNYTGGRKMTQTYKVQVSMNQAHLVESGFVWKQGDFGFNLEIEVLDFDTSGVTPQIIFRKSAGAVESTSVTQSSNKFTYTFAGTELDTPGPGICDLKLKNSTTQRISTASFKFFVIPDTEDGLNEQASSYSDTIAQIIEGYEDDVDELRGELQTSDKAIDVLNNTNSGNVFSVSTMSGYWDTSDGTKKEYVTALNCTEKFIVSDKEIITVTNNFSTNIYYLYWDASGTYLGYYRLAPGESRMVLNTAKYCALNYYASESVASINLFGITKTQNITNENIAIISKVINKPNLFNGVIHNGIHSQTNGDRYGTITANDNYFYTDLIPVDNIEKLYAFSDFIGSTDCYITYFDINQIVIGKVNGKNLFIKQSDFPANTAYFIVCMNKTYKESLMLYTSVPDMYISYNNYDVFSGNNITKKYKRIDHGLISNKYPPSSGKVYPLGSTNNVYCSYLINLTGLSKISYKNLGAYISLYYVNDTGTVLSNVVINDASGTLTIPDGAVACIYYSSVNGDPEHKFTLVAGETIPDDIYGFDEIEIDGLNIPQDYLSGKKIVFDGDSITEGAGVTDITTGIAPNNNKGWGYWIQKNHPGSICYGYGQSGWTVGRRENETDSLLNHISQYPEDVDLFVLSGGYNDQARQMAMGELVEVTDGADAYFNATFDEYTFIGALESWFQQLRSTYPYAKIVYVITPQRIYSSNPCFNNDTKGQRVYEILYSTGKERMDLFWEKIRTVCEKWSIKYLDLSKTSGVVGTGETTDPGLTIGTRYFSVNQGVPDFTHPNSNYYKELLVPQIEDLISSVMPK